MKKKLLGLVFLGLLLLSPIVQSAGKADLSGKFSNGDLYFITSVDYSWETKSEDVERDIEFDYRYQDKASVRTTNRGLIAFKQRYELVKNIMSSV